MKTEIYLPTWDFDRTMKCLDKATLKQVRFSAKAILDALIQDDFRKNHLIIESQVKMWKGHEYMVAVYGICACREWINRNYQDANFRFYFQDYLLKLRPEDPNYFGLSFNFREFILNEGRPEFPWYFGETAFHSAQKMLLIRKSKEHYLPQWPNIPKDTPIWYPTAEEPE